MDDEEEVAESEVQFCINCRSQELQRTDEALTCKVAECTFQLRRVGDDKDARGRLLEAAKELGMKFCYACGEELQQEEELLMCSGDDGCGMKFVVPTQPIPKPESQDVIISEDDVNYCIVCEKGELRKTKKVLMCKGKRCKFKLQRGDDKDVLTKLQTASKELGMNYCYVCGEKLEEDDDVLMCSGEGCGMKFPLVHSRPAPQHVDPKSASTEVRSPTASLRKSPESEKPEGIVQPPNNSESRGMQGSQKVVSDPDGRTLSASTPKQSTAAADVGDSKSRRGDPLSPVSDSTTTDQRLSDPLRVQELESEKSVSELPDKRNSQSAKTEEKWTEKPPALTPPTTNAATKPLPSESSGKNTSAVAVVPTNTKNPEADFLVGPDEMSEIVSILDRIDDWRELGRQLHFERRELDEIGRAVDPQQCKNDLLDRWFMCADPSFAMFGELADAVDRMGKVQVAEQIRMKSQEIQTALMQGVLVESEMSRSIKERMSSFTTESFLDKLDPIGMLMLSRPAPEMKGKQLQQYIEKRTARGTRKFSTQMRECVKIVFHALVPKSAWGWDNRSSIHIRFGHPNLGEWKYDCGIFKEKSHRMWNAEEIIEMEGIFYIPESLLKNVPGGGVAYKYVVYSQKVMSNELTYWEFTPPPPDVKWKGFTNRCLVVDESLRKAGATHHQYDHILLITPPSGSWTQSIPLIGRWLTRSKDAHMYKAESYSVALQIYLHSFSLKFENPVDPPILDIMKDGAEMAAIFTGLYHSYYCQDGDAREAWPVNPEDCTFLLDWTAETVKTVLQCSFSTPKERIRQFSVGATLLFFLYKTRFSGFAKQLDCARNLLQLLAPQPFTPPSKPCVCYELRYLDEQQESLRNSVFPEMLGKMCCALMECDEIYPEWLYGVPLLHYLQGHITLYQPAKVIPGPSTWAMIYAGLPVAQYHIKIAKKEESRFAQRALQVCRPLFMLDGLLIWTYVIACPFESFCWILESKPSSAPVIAALLEYACPSKYARGDLLDSECIEIIRLINGVISAIDTLEIHNEAGRLVSTRLSAFEYSNTVQAGIAVFGFFGERCGAKDSQLAVITTVIKLILRGISGKINKEGSDSGSPCNTDFESIGLVLTRWLESKKVTGSSRFGKDGAAATEEMKIWHQMLQVNYDSELYRRWCSMISKVVEERVDKLSAKDKLKLMKLPEAPVPQPLQSVMAKSIVKDIKQGGLQREGTEVLLPSFFQNLDPSSGEIVGAYLKQHFPQHINLELILTWELWPQYFQVYNQHLPTLRDLEKHVSPLVADRWEQIATLLELESKVEEVRKIRGTSGKKCCDEILKTWLEGSGVAPKSWQKILTLLIQVGLQQESKQVAARSKSSKSFLPEETEELCERAFIIFRSMCQKLVSGEISVAEMEAIHRAHGSTMKSNTSSETHTPVQEKHSQQIKLLHMACSHRSGHHLPPLNEVMLCLQDRLFEYKQFCDKKKKLWTLRQHCSRISPGDCVIVEEMVKKSEDMERLLDVCRVRKDSHPKSFDFPCFEIAEEVEQVLDPFSIMIEEKQTKLFADIWNKCVSDILNSFESQPPTLKLKDVSALFWNSVYSECEKILQELSSSVIPLYKVRRHFSQMDTPQKMKQEVHTLADAINDCRRINNMKPIPCPEEDALYKIQLYNQLCHFKEAGQTLIHLRQTLGLTDVAADEPEHMQITTEIKDDSPLSVIDESVVTTELDLLREIADEPLRMRCLESFCHSYNLMEWIRTETTSVSKMQYVVQLILQSSSGDEVLVNDLLTQLLTVANAFASLIYDPIPKDASNDVLADRCRKVWKALEDTPDLNKILMNCSEHLQQFRHWWETAADMKQSTFTQMEAINANGEYEISSKDCVIAHSVDEVVRLHVREEGLEDRMFGLSELQELHGKLVLIAGGKGENVNKFLEILHLVQLVAELLVTLQQAGNAHYITFALKFGCANIQPGKLDDLVKMMEKDLHLWQKQVEKVRKQYYWLNYYTTKQLFMLREELGKLKLQQQEMPLSTTLLSLLQCVSMKPTPSDVYQCLQNVQKKIAQLPHFVSTAKSETTSQRSSSVLTPGLRGSSLNEDQRRLFDLLHNEFSKTLVLTAIAESGEEDEDSLRNWCIENEYKFVGEEDFVASDLSECFSDEEDESHTEDVVDENHPFVKILIEEDDYPVDIAINAVRRCKSDIDGARQAALEESGGFRVQSATAAAAGEPELSARYTTISFLITWDGKSDTSYLDINEVGEFLKELSYPRSHQVKDVRFIQRERKLPRRFAIKRGSPNLLTVDSEGVWKAILSVYIQDDSLPLPTFEEVLICTENTTLEEVTLLWHRAVNDPGQKRIFCLVHAEQLPYRVCEQALQALDTLTQGCNDYCIVIICTNRGQEWSHILSRLAPFQRNISHMPSDVDISKYLKQHFKEKGQILEESATSVDAERSCVRLVFSTRAGMGKTLHVQRLAENPKLSGNTSHALQYVRIPIHGPDVSPDTVMRHLQQHSQSPNEAFPQILHFDVACKALPSVANVLFSILVLGGLTDSHGKVWRHQPSQLLVVECTLVNVAVNLQNGEWLYKEQIAADKHASSHSLLSLLPSTYCISPTETNEVHGKEALGVRVVLMDEGVHKSEPVQRVFQYLRRLQSKVSLDRFSYVIQSLEGTPSTCLSLLLKKIQPSNESPAWSEVSHFVNFLNIQLKDCETSIYCDLSLVGDTLPQFKDFVTRFMVQMSEEYTAPSLKAAQCDDSSGTHLEDVYNFSDQHTWISRKHPYLFFNEDHISMTFLGFSIDGEGNLVDPSTQETIEGHIMSRRLRDGLERQGVNFEEDYNTWGSDKMLLKLASVLGCTKLSSEHQPYVENPDPTYVLTYDNVMKMLAIHMRFRCNIPVIMMGETGCGKTRLLRYLCDLQGKAHGLKNLICLKVHGGTTPDIITAVVKRARVLARDNEKKLMEEAKRKGRQYNPEKVHTVLFFDEANTTEALELIKEIMCDRCVDGEPIKENLKFAAACNPYRRHTEKMLTKLRTAGLGFYDTSTMLTTGTTNPYELVYRVLELPPAMQRLVYDFGQISGETEKKYIRQIVHNHVLDNKHIAQQQKEAVENATFEVVSCCQRHMREQKDECSFVSLRDVIRMLIVFEWSLQMMSEIDEFSRLLRKKEEEDEIKYKTQIQPLKPVTRSLILAVAVCYHARLSDQDNREKFQDEVTKYFILPYEITEGPQRFRKEIERCQMVFLEEMNLPMNIAHNAALRENVFMMVVCIENRLPLFLVGKPGSSKSLAKTIVANSMAGRNSPSELLRNFKQVQVFPYQCSQYSTANSVLDVFEESKRFQERMDPAKFASVVVLEEVGLAEASPGLPLKVLHPYLEDGTAGLNLDEEEVQRENRVAFIGISNWALDPAKMNRGIMVTRVPPDDNELVGSADGIAGSLKNSQIQVGLQTFFHPLAQMYRTLCQKQLSEATDVDTDIEGKREFFGLRDFYSLIKMLCSMCLYTQKPPTWSQLEHAIRRNFSGLKNLDPVEHLPNKEEVKASCRPPEHDEFQPSCTPLGLIEASMITFAPEKPTIEPWQKVEKNRPMEEAVKAYSDNRYLLFLTENNSALRILDTHLLAESGETPFVLYGSSFRRDQEYTQVCRNINQIKVHMETGKPVVLLNLENIYESLYDLLNQCYTELPKGRYVDLGLRTHRIKCRVHETFRLIIIADRRKVSKQFPTALINRLEKHFVLSSSILDSEQTQIVKEIGEWARQFATVKHTLKHLARSADFEEGDAFVGFQKDTVASVVLHATEVLKQKSTEPYSTEKVKEKSYHLLLQLASQDALARLSITELGVDKASFTYAFETYFDVQKHTSLAALVKHYIHNPDVAKLECLHSEKGTLLQVTTYGLLLSHVDVKTIAQEVKMGEHDIHLLMLQEFDTEMDFSRKIRNVFQKDTSAQRLLIVQCDNGHSNSDLIACARYRVVDERNKEETVGISHVVFVIQLPRVACGTSYASFQGGAWISAHIDDLKGSEAAASLLKVALNEPVSKFFETLKQEPSNSSPFSPNFLLRSSVQKAVSELISPQFKKRAEDLVELLLALIPPERDDTTSGAFTTALMERISTILEERDESMLHPKEWALREASDGHKLQSGYTLINTLADTLQRIIREMLTYIIVSIDCNNNLSLIDSQDQMSHLSQVWLTAFRNPSLVRLHFDELFASKNASTLLSSSKYQYSSQFPFSWLVIPEIESIYSTTPSQQSGLGESFKGLCDAVAGHAVEQVLSVVDPAHVEDLRTRYLHDFLLELVSAADENKIMKLLQDSVVHVSTELLKVQTHSCSPLTKEVVAIHASFHSMRIGIYWMMQLLKHFPELALELEEIPGITKEMLLPWNAVKLVMKKLSPDQVEMADDLQRRKWMQKVHLCRNVIESLLACSTSSGEAAKLQLEARTTWLRLLTVLLYVEHIVMKLPTSLPTLKSLPKRLFNSLKPGAVSFSEGDVLIRVIRVIKANVATFKQHKDVPNLICQNCKRKKKLSEIFVVPCSANHMVCAACFYSARNEGGTKCPKCGEYMYLTDKPDLPGSMKKQLEEYSDLQQRCRDFFMEFVAQICFSPASPEQPNESFIYELLDIALNLDDPKYEEFFPITEEQCLETIPVMRSFLLQFTLEFSPTKAREYLDKYLQKGHEKIGGQFLKDNVDLYLLCAKSIESGHFKNYSKLQSLNERLPYASEKLRESLAILSDLKEVENHAKAMDITYLESVAKARFGFCVTAEILHDFLWHSDKFYALQYSEKTAIEQLIVRSHEVCTQALIGLKADLRHFLIKQVVRQYGLSCWSDVSQDEQVNSWIIPPNLRSATSDGKKSSDLDPFMMYGSDYSQLHQSLIYSSADVKECLKESQALQPVPLLLALYKRAYTQLPSTTKSHHRIIHVLQQLRYWVHECQFFQPNMNAAISGCDLQEIQREPTFSPWESFTEKCLAEIIVHTLSVLSSKLDDPLLQLLALPFTNPTLLMEKYIPTMPDDMFEDALKIFVHETVWECPNGHKYFIGNCGRPWVTAKCPVPGCGATIGGIRHKATQETTKLDKDSAADFVKCGLILGAPQRRSAESVSWRERDLSQESCTIIRILLHASCVWGALSLDQEHQEALSRSIHPPVKSKNLLNYFWHHMEKDLEILVKLTSRKEQDAALIVHCTLQHIFNSDKTAEYGAQYTCLTSEERNKWESDFDAAYILPVYQDLDAKLTEAQKAVMNDTSEEQAELFRIVSEQEIKKRARDIDSQLWSYHPKIGPNHLTTALRKYRGPPLKLLEEFLKKEHILQALQYLPDIVQLQMFLHEICNCRLDKADAQRMEMSHFMKNYVPIEHRQKGFRQMVENFCKAWNMVKDFLPLPDEEYRDAKMSEQQTLVYFIPSGTGPGVCSMTLATYLARTQNDMIEYSWSKSDEYGTSNRQYSVPLNKIQKCHVIDHEQHFEHVILSHCSYSLMAGYGEEVTYDFPALEKHILDRFLLGKPSIAPVNIPTVSFKGDVLKTSKFAQVRNNIPQVHLSQQHKQEIIAEVTRAHQLQKTIDIVSVALGFLTYTTWAKNALLSRYIRDVLKMPRPFTPKVEQYCTVGHAISLWRTLCVEHGRLCTIGGQDPFPEIDSICKAPLNEDEKAQLDVCLKQFELDQFLESLFEFIITHVQHLQEGDGEHEMGLVERFVDQVVIYKIDEIPDFESNFPDDILLSKVVEVWKFAVKYQARNKNEVSS